MKSNIANFCMCVCVCMCEHIFTLHICTYIIQAARLCALMRCIRFNILHTVAVIVAAAIAHTDFCLRFVFVFAASITCICPAVLVTDIKDKQARIMSFVIQAALSSNKSTAMTSNDHTNKSVLLTAIFQVLCEKKMFNDFWQAQKFFSEFAA